MKPITLFLFIILLASCNNQQNTEAAKASAADSTEKKTAPFNCYQYASTSDTISLKLIYVGSSITGTLVYNLKEKDKNKGTIQGSMRGDLLVGNYTFMSEGVQSVRQVAFKKEGNAFIEGYGDSEEKDGSVHFKSVDSLSFNVAVKLVETECK